MKNEKFRWKSGKGSTFQVLFQVLVEKWEIQVIVSMIMLTRSSERIINSSRYTGKYSVTVCSSVMQLRQLANLMYSAS